MSVASLQTEASLDGFDGRIGGYAGPETPGAGQPRPAAMPTKAECDHVVRTAAQFLRHIGTDDVSIYIDDDIDLTGEYNIRCGSGITLVGGFCDPARREHGGRGPVIYQEYYNPPRYGQECARTLVSKWGEAPTLWGVAFEGPNRNYFDPEERVTSTEWDSEAEQDWYATGLWCYDDRGELEVYGCEFAGWTMAGVELGSRDHLTQAVFERCSFHDNFMMSMGYGVEQYNGTAAFDLCYFDRCRHGISGFGYPTESWELRRSVIGVGPWCGHALDMHKEDNNLHNGSIRAGNRIIIDRCTIMCTDDIREFGQEGFALRGIPKSFAKIRRTQFYHERKPTAINKQGEAYRQEEVESWTNFYVSECLFGREKQAAGIGAPRAQQSPDEPDTPPVTPPDDDSSMSELRIEGMGEAGQYHVFVSGGDVEPTADIEANDAITPRANGQIELSGGIVGQADTYTLMGESQPVRATWETPCAVYLDDEEITGRLVGAQLDRDVTRLDAELAGVKGRVGAIVETLKAAVEGLE